MTDSPVNMLTYTGLFFLVVFAFRSLGGRIKRPPGPKGLPLIGNALDIPVKQQSEWFARLGKQYGEAVLLNILGRPYVVLNTQRASIDLLVKQSATSSDRPVLPFAGELCGFNRVAALLRVDTKAPTSNERKSETALKATRRHIHTTMGPGPTTRVHKPLQLRESRRFLKKLRDTPEKFYDHIEWVMHSVLLELGYGHTSKEEHDPYIEISCRALADFDDASTPGKWLVDVIPFVKYLPSWFPGGNFKNVAKKYIASSQEFAQVPYEFAKKRLANGEGKDCVCASLIEEYSAMEGGLTPEREEFIMWTAVTILGAGTDTNSSSLKSFFLAMALFPDIQRRVQQEIDSVCAREGSSPRLPDFDDKDSLPYVNALVSELFRWGVVTPLGFPHLTTAPMEYNGWTIPKGTCLIANVRGICHDPERYSDPLEFKPERFLGPTSDPDPRGTMFGFGRRECPGMAFSNSFLFALIVSTLRCFDISAIKGEEPEREFVGEILSHPKPFRCNIRPRIPLDEMLA